MHGSLARAGKVRGQTPKVAKQDKKKQPKGRAMKRIKYNRRFVNVVVVACDTPFTCPTVVPFPPNIHVPREKPFQRHLYTKRQPTQRGTSARALSPNNSF